MEGDFNPEHFDCSGNYADPDTGRLPPNAEILRRTMEEYVDAPAGADPVFDNIFKRVKSEVDAEYADYADPRGCRIQEESIGSDDESWESESSVTEASESCFDEEIYRDDPVPMENLPGPRLPADSETLSLYNMNAAVVVPKGQRWEDLTDSGYRLAAAGKKIGGQDELVGPLAMYFSSGAAAMKGKLKGSQSDFNEAVTDILSSMMVENLVQSQAANIGILSSDSPFSSDYMKLLKAKQQLDGQILRIIEARQKLTSVPVRIRHADQVNMGNVQQVVNGDGGKGG